MYIYIYVHGIVIFHNCMSVLESTLSSLCKPQSKLDLPMLRKGSEAKRRVGRSNFDWDLQKLNNADSITDIQI